MADKSSDQKPAILIQVVCVTSLVILSAIDAASRDFAVNTIVYAIIAGVLFGVGSIKQIFGGKD